MLNKTPEKTTMSKVKLAFVWIGVFYLVAAGAYGTYVLLSRTMQPQGASDLAAHPERQDEIVTDRQARELQEMLSLTDTQTQEIAQILHASRQEPRPAQAGRGPETMMAGRRELREKISAVLTEEQREKCTESRMGRERGFGPGGMGRGGGMDDPERRERMRQVMEQNGIDPDEFEKLPPEERRKRMREMRQRGGFRGPGAGNRQRRPRQ